MISLGSCQLGDSGSKQLTKGKWPNLLYLHLGNLLVTQVEMGSSTMGALRLQATTGRNWRWLRCASNKMKLVQLLLWAWWFSSTRTNYRFFQASFEVEAGCESDFIFPVQSSLMIVHNHIITQLKSSSGSLKSTLFNPVTTSPSLIYFFLMKNTEMKIAKMFVI